ncbi:RHS repeat-associated core domain-containing protein [Polycladospora coralii]|nr:RHS repeat-associated core domain-containing protein [Polycladospora coralii]
MTSRRYSIRATYGYTMYGENQKEAFTGVDKIDEANPDKAMYNPYRYTGKRWDDETETYDMGFRNYNPSIARFDTRDMYADAAQDIGLAMSLATGSRYAFAGGNPVSYSELDGHLPQAYDTSITNKEVFKAHRETHDGESYGQTLTKQKKKLNTGKPKGKACDWECGKKKREAKGGNSTKNTSTTKPKPPEPKSFLDTVLDSFVDEMSGIDLDDVRAGKYTDSDSSLNWTAMWKTY